MYTREVVHGVVIVFTPSLASRWDRLVAHGVTFDYTSPAVSAEFAMPRTKPTGGISVLFALGVHPDQVLCQPQFENPGSCQYLR